jgi:SAM-dependent methyltransferase
MIKLIDFERKIWASNIGKIYNYAGYVIDRFVFELSRKIKPDQNVLDAGAGTCPYKKYFSLCNYVSQDFCENEYGLSYAPVDIKSEIYNIPRPDSSFDYILCSQVLEHLKYPRKAFKEFNRLLKPGGQLWLSCPLAWEEHDTPYDFFRYTKYALTLLGEEENFKTVRITPTGGRFISTGKFIKDLLPGMAPNLKISLLLILLQAPIVVPILFIFYFLDRFDKKKELTTNYLVIYEKV